MHPSDYFALKVSCNNFVRRSATGSALIMCLVFLSALSAVALGGLEAAWTGQRMISAYVSHQQIFLRLEQELLLREQTVWQHIETYGLGHFLATSQETDNATVVVKTHGQWIAPEFTRQQCGALFEVIASPEYDVSSELKLEIRWEVCCQSKELCMAADFIQRRRLWSRVTDDAVGEY